jgi:signal transduction histidine kinase
MGPATTTLRAVVALLATLIRCAGILYTIVQVAIWHTFYTDSMWHLTAPLLAVVWAVTVAFSLRKQGPSPFFACVDSVFYVALALGMQWCVPAGIRDNAANWLVISMSGQLIVPAWYAPGVLAVPLALSLPLAYWGGAVLQSGADVRTLAGSVLLLLIVGLVHGVGRRVIYGGAVTADGDLARADQAAREHYAILCRDIERREHERLVHDTVLNTLTALARPGGTALAEVVTRCRQDVALIEAALSAGDPEAASGDLDHEVRAVVADMRARGLTVHLAIDDPAAGEAVSARAATALANAVREALSNVAAHSGTTEAWVTVRRRTAADDAGGAGRLRVVIRDLGAGFDLAHVNKARLGLRRSITERMAECGGQALIRSAPGQGTEVSLTWPAPRVPDAAPVAEHLLAPEGRPW